MIKFDWGKLFPKIEKWLTPEIKDRKVTYFNSSLKFLKERKYVIEFKPVKRYKKGHVFLMAKTLKISQITPNAGKVVFTIVNASFIPMLPSILEQPILVRNLSPQKQIKKNLTILQTNGLSNLSSA